MGAGAGRRARGVRAHASRSGILSKSAPWKQALARQLREAVAPPYSWLAEKLTMGQSSSVRVYVHGAGAQPAGTLERGFDRAPGPGPSPAYDPLEFISGASSSTRGSIRSAP